MSDEEFRKKYGDFFWRTVRGVRMRIVKNKKITESMKIHKEIYPERNVFDKLKREDVTKARLDIKKEEHRENAQKNANNAKKYYKNGQKEKFNKEFDKFKKRTNKIKELNNQEKEYDKPIEASDFRGVKGKHIDKKQFDKINAFKETKQSNNAVSEIKVKGENNVIPSDFKKAYGKFKVETNANSKNKDDRFEITKDEYGTYHAKNLRTGETFTTFKSHLQNNNVFEFENDTKAKINAYKRKKGK